MFKNKEFSPLKVIILGDGSTGKTSFYERLSKYHDPEYRFNKKYKATTSFNLKKLELDTNKGKITLFLWDTAGQEKYGGDLRDGYIQGANAAIILYDVTNRNTIDNVQKWLDNINQVCNLKESIPISVVGNKIDKVPQISSLDHVKLRDARLKSMYGHKNITNTLISVKENLYLKNAKFMCKEKIEDEGVLKPIEYLLSNICGCNIEIVKNQQDAFHDGGF